MTERKAIQVTYSESGTIGLFKTGRKYLLVWPDPDGIKEQEFSDYEQAEKIYSQLVKQIYKPENKQVTK